MIRTEWYELAVDGGRTLKFPTMGPQPGEPKHTEQSDITAATEVYSTVPQQYGGIIKRGAWCWISTGNVLEITALRTGQTIATYGFVEPRGYENCCIRCVEELFPQNNETVLLAISLECFSAAESGCSLVAIYSIERNQVLSCMELPLHITALAFVSSNCCRRSLLQNFDGCIAVGSEEGVILLLDLNINKLINTCDERLKAPIGQLTDDIVKCRIVDYNLQLAEIHRTFREARQDGVNFGLQVEAINDPCAVQSLLPIDLTLGLAVGTEDGRLILYDLAELQIVHNGGRLPQPQRRLAPIVKMSYIEPVDDPRCCLYVWALHDTNVNLTAVMHTVVYDKRVAEDDGFYYFECFCAAASCLVLPLEDKKCVPIGCQSINKLAFPSPHNISLNGSIFNKTEAEENGYCLCAISWYSPQEEKNKLLIFDLNQWYREEMRNYYEDSTTNPSYLAGYVLSKRECALSLYVDPNTVAYFNTLQRFEEHFYPNSLSFDCTLLHTDSSLGYTWLGAQNIVISMLRASNSSIFLEPEMCFKEILRTRLLPQFCELNVDSTFSRLAIYETILSAALEHNCFSLLRDCAKCWADGSFMGCNFTATTGISLSTLTDWLWKRAADIKKRTNELSKRLFDYSVFPLDQREQKEFGTLTRQLKLLADLLHEVLTAGKRYIPDRVFHTLETQHKSLKMLTEYQEVLLWLVSIGLLPEVQPRIDSYSFYQGMRNRKRSSALPKVREADVHYPYEDLKNLYARKRALFERDNDNFISKKTGSCRLLFVDALIAHECNSDALRECWLENGGNGLYPPPSIEAMLRVMLVPEVEFESKCAILLYFFLDLHMTMDDQTHKGIVESFVKFPSVFKLTATLIKTVQSFWNLDHGLFQPAVEEFISPFNNNQTYNQWMLEVLVESLLTQNAADYALRILEARPTLISPILKLKTLLANELTSEAFHFARTKQDDSLLELFFKCCLCAGKYGVIRDLALNEREGQLVQRLLRSSKILGAENLHFVYLLQKSKYIEAVSYLDELSRAKSQRQCSNESSNMLRAHDTPNLVLSAFNTTMAPVTQGLTDVYFRIKNKIKKKEADNRSPVPLSCQLIKQNANNLLGGIYHSSALSAHFATYYWGEMHDERRARDSTTANSLLSANNAPFLRKPQGETCHLQLEQAPQTGVSYPRPYRLTEKRTLAERELEQVDVPEEVPNMALHTNAQPRKRRRLLGQEIVEDLGHFIQQNKSASQLTAYGFDLQGVCDTPSYTSECTQQNKTATGAAACTEYLTQPLMTPRRRTAALNDNRRDSCVGASELHSILKTSNLPERSVRAQSARRELHAAMDDSKNLRFTLPAATIAEETKEKTEINAKESTAKAITHNEEIAESKESGAKPSRRLVTTTTVDDEEENVGMSETPLTIATTLEAVTYEDVEMAEDDIIDEVLIEVHHEKLASATPSPTKHKEETRAISVSSSASESNRESDAHDEQGEEEEDFYSPLSSRNNSLLADNLRSPPQSTTSIFESATSKIFRFCGPQPRKPLARLSAERSQSRTPEKELLAPRQRNDGEEAEVEKPTEQSEPPSSGYVTANASSNSTTAANTIAMSSNKTTLEIKSVVSLASTEFTPHCSSSKLTTQSKFILDEAESLPHPGKLSECSTMVGSFTVEEIELTTESADGVIRTEEEKPAPVYVQLKTSTDFACTKRTEVLQANTTLGMSSYEFTLPEAKTTSPGATDDKQKAAILKVMETVEVMDTDEHADDVHEVEFNEEQQSTIIAPVAATIEESDLYASALGIPTQPTENVEIADSDYSDDVVALYENQREAVEKHKNQADTNDCNSSSSSVIILSSPASSEIRTNEPFYFRPESDDEDNDDDDEDENDDDDDEDDEAEGRTNNGDSSCSSIEIISEEEELAPAYPQVPKKQKLKTPKGRMTLASPALEVIREVAESNASSESKTTTEESNESKISSAPVGKNEERMEANIEDDAVEVEDSSLHSMAASVESESRFVIEEVASSCVDIEELAMRETITFEDSDEAELEPSSSGGTKKEIFFNKSVFIQDGAEITIEQLQESAYISSSQEVYEYLGGDVFYCDAEKTIGTMEMREEREIEITVESASTSANILKERAKDVMRTWDELPTTSEKLKPEVKLPVRSPKDDGIEKEVEEESHKEKIRLPSQTEVAIEGTEEAEKTDKSPIGSSEKHGQAESGDEEQIKLHVEEGDLSEAELTDTKADGSSATTENVSGTKINVPQVEQTEKHVVSSPQIILEDLSEKPTSFPSTQDTINESETVDKSANSPKKSVQEKETEEKMTSIRVQPALPKRTDLVEHETENHASTPTQRRLSLRGTSVPPPPVDIIVNTPIDEGSVSKRRHTRGISMPPQSTAQQERDAAVHTPETRVSSRRSVRASSMQPSDDGAAQLGTPRARRSTRGTSVPHDADEAVSTSTPVRTGRGTSVPPAAKIATRRRSNLLDAVNEITPVAVDSPSTRTRSRMRLNSGDSELDSSVVSGGEQASQAKRMRRTSISSSVSEQPTTPSSRRTRHSIAAANTDTTGELSTPKSLRRTTRSQNIDAENLDATQPLEEREREKSPKTSEQTTDAALYSSARRLTRTQLAIMEKSAALRKNTNAEGLRSGVSISSPTAKRVGKRRSSRSTVPDSDDLESISSHISNVSGAQRRRVTRSSMKDKEENDDDLVSVASSVGSERKQKRRSKESKSSPNSTLSTIQEDEAEEETVQKKRSRLAKKRSAKNQDDASP
uniref:Protein ELYS n=3 Tax=Ceratitis capitata TaxID=7213 RepID=W8ARA9_CERCA